MNFAELTNPAQANAPVVVNRNFEAIEGAGLYGYNAATTTGLTEGYLGGNYGTTAITASTVALTDATTNYVVAHRTTGAVSTSTATTNWNDNTTYGRVRRCVTSGGAVTGRIDWRWLEGGIFDRTSAGVAASAVTVADAGGYFTGTDVEAALQEVGAALASAGKVPAQRFTIELANTTDSDPGVGLVKFNNATPASATQLYIDDETSDGVDLSTFFASLPATGFLKIQSVADAGEWAIFKWTATTDGTGYWKFTTVPQASKGTLDDADAVLIEFDSDANTGSGGTELKGLTFTSDTGSTADSDPGNGLFKWNHATQGSATKLFVDNATLDSITATTFFADLGTSAHVYIQQGDDATRWQMWKVTGATADSGYYDFDVSLLAKSSSDIQDDKTCYFDFKKVGGGGSTQGKQSIYIPAGAMLPSASGGCDSLTVGATTASRPDVAFLSFDETTAEYAQFSVVMPKKWDEGTITFLAHWSHGATTTNFGVAIGLQAVAVSDDDTIDVAYGTQVVVTDTGGTTNDLYTTSESSAITVAGTPAAEDMVFFRVGREPANGSDTMARAMRLHGITLYVTTNADTDA